MPHALAARRPRLALAVSVAVATLGQVGSAATAATVDEAPSVEPCRSVLSPIASSSLHRALVGEDADCTYDGVATEQTVATITWVDAAGASHPLALTAAACAGDAAEIQGPAALTVPAAALVACPRSVEATRRVAAALPAKTFTALVDRSDAATRDPHAPTAGGDAGAGVDMGYAVAEHGIVPESDRTHDDPGPLDAWPWTATLLAFLALAAALASGRAALGWVDGAWTLRAKLTRAGPWALLPALALGLRLLPRRGLVAPADPLAELYSEPAFDGALGSWFGGLLETATAPFVAALSPERPLFLALQLLAATATVAALPTAATRLGFSRLTGRLAALVLALAPLALHEDAHVSRTTLPTMLLVLGALALPTDAVSSRTARAAHLATAATAFALALLGAGAALAVGAWLAAALALVAAPRAAVRPALSVLALTAALAAPALFAAPSAPWSTLSWSATQPWAPLRSGAPLWGPLVLVAVFAQRSGGPFSSSRRSSQPSTTAPAPPVRALALAAILVAFGLPAVDLGDGHASTRRALLAAAPLALLVGHGAATVAARLPRFASVVSAALVALLALPGLFGALAPQTPDAHVAAWLRTQPTTADRCALALAPDAPAHVVRPATRVLHEHHLGPPTDRQRPGLHRCATALDWPTALPGADTRAALAGLEGLDQGLALRTLTPPPGGDAPAPSSASQLLLEHADTTYATFALRLAWLLLAAAVPLWLWRRRRTLVTPPAARVWAVAALALALRLALPPHGIGDTNNHFNTAFADPGRFHPWNLGSHGQAYESLLALLFTVVPPSLQVGLVVNLVLGTLAAALVVLLARRLGASPRAATLAGVAMALMPVHVRLSGAPNRYGVVVTGLLLGWVVLLDATSRTPAAAAAPEPRRIGRVDALLALALAVPALTLSAQARPDAMPLPAVTALLIVAAFGLPWSRRARTAPARLAWLAFALHTLATLPAVGWFGRQVLALRADGYGIEQTEGTLGRSLLDELLLPFTADGNLYANAEFVPVLWTAFAAVGALVAFRALGPRRALWLVGSALTLTWVAGHFDIGGGLLSVRYHTPSAPLYAVGIGLGLGAALDLAAARLPALGSRSSAAALTLAAAALVAAVAWPRLVHVNRVTTMDAERGFLEAHLAAIPDGCTVFTFRPTYDHGLRADVAFSVGAGRRHRWIESSSLPEGARPDAWSECAAVYVSGTCSGVFDLDADLTARARWCTDLADVDRAIAEGTVPNAPAGLHMFVGERLPVGLYWLSEPGPEPSATP